MTDGTSDALPPPTTPMPSVSQSPTCPVSDRPTIGVISSEASDTTLLTSNQHVNSADPQNLQYKIYLELIKLNAHSQTSSSAPFPQENNYSPYISRRNAFWASAQPTPIPSAHGQQNSKAMLQGAEYDALGQQFTTLAIVSTFTANLTIAFLVFAHNLISGRQDIFTYGIVVEIGEFLALIGVAIHAGVIIISGRCSALALKHAKRFTVQATLNDEQKGEGEREYKTKCEEECEAETSNHFAQSMTAKERPPVIINTTTRAVPQFHSDFSHYDATAPFPSLPYFCRFLTVCETLQLLGTAFFFFGVGVLLFIMFFHPIFPIMLAVGCVIGTCALSWRFGFWKISASRQLVSAVSSAWTRWVSAAIGT